jgi:hypothetical protein
MNRQSSPLAGTALDRLLRSELAGLLDRIAAAPDADPAVGSLDAEARARMEEAEARLAAVRLRLLAGYEEWRRALEDCADLWALSRLRAATAESEPDRRAA